MKTLARRASPLSRPSPRIRKTSAFPTTRPAEKRGGPTAVCSPHLSAAKGQKRPPDHRAGSSPKNLLPTRALWTNIPHWQRLDSSSNQHRFSAPSATNRPKEAPRRQNSFPYAKPHPCPCSVTKCPPNPVAVAPFPTSTNSPRLWQINCKRPPDHRTASPAQSRSPAGTHC
ncbi:hypothetical protein HMPREF0262_02975 [Clostridium sp. ATCC 29733]|nr:hypothetical protein HMPREF0262_02975 [Clostridium sp. ATCC 29733]